jgi:hypothetical protein
MHFERLPSEEPHLVRANVYYTDTDSQVVLTIEEMECVSTAELNRIGGTLKIGSKSTASDFSVKEA